MWKVLLKNCVEELGKAKLCERSDSKCRKSGWPDQVKKLSGKIQQESCVEKWYGTIKLTIFW